MGITASPEDLAEAFFSAINAGDLEAAIELWLEDAVFVAAGAPPLEGRQAIRGVLATLIDNGSQMSAEDVVTHVAGGIAVRSGRLRLAGQAPGSEPFETVTDFVTVYTLTKDGWRIALDAPAGLR